MRPSLLRSRTEPLLAIVAIAVAVSGAAIPVLAFDSVQENARWEVPRLGAPSQHLWETYQADQVRPLAPTPVEAFVARYGGKWLYQVNQSTGAYHHIFGSGLDLGRPVNSEQEAEGLARAFVRDHESLFGIGNEDLAVRSVAHGLGKWSVILRQTYQGIAVWDGRAHLVFTDAGRLFEMGSDAYPGIDVSPLPALSEHDALSVAESDIGFEEGRDKVSLSEVVVLPVEIGAEGLEYRLAYVFDLRVDVPMGVWRTFVDANTGEILWRQNRIRFLDYSGHVQGDVEWDSYCDGYTNDYPLRNMKVTISGLGSAYTDAYGDFVLPYGGTDPRAIAAEFLGRWVNVSRQGGGDATHSGTITPGVPYTIDWSDANSLPSERDVFAGVNKQHDWLKAIDPDYTGVDYEMAASVERTDGYCPGNAWWNGSGIAFCAQGSGYGNTGRMEDVIYHEYAHGITDFLYGDDDPPGDVHEGNSDFAASLLTREHIVGLGFYLNQCSSGIRDCENDIQYPCYGEEHYCGQVLAGFHWDSWEELLASYPQAYADSVISYTWHYGRKLGLPQDMADQVHWAFVADDDDGDLSNGTPHHDQFCVGATNHGFTCPPITRGVFIVHTPLVDMSSTTVPYEVRAEITSTGGVLVVDSCRVAYRVDGGSFVLVPMTATGGPDEYAAYIPAQQACSRVEYYIHAADNAGYWKRHPADAPSSLHSFLVGLQVAFEDDFETDEGWTAGLPGDDAETGMWELCDPEGTEAQAEDDHTPDPGTTAYVTQCEAGISQGTWDVDEGRTTLESPVFDLAGSDHASVTYYRWYSNNTGANPGQDYWVVRVSDDGWLTSAALESTNVSSRSWTFKKFDVGSYVDLTSTVRFRFIASDYEPGSLVEAGVDDFRVSVCSAARDTVAPAVAVLDPKGGEVIPGGGGATYVIRWTSADSVGVCWTAVLLSTDGGSTYPDTVASGPLDSTCVWEVPDVDQGRCRIKVVCADGAGNHGSDASDGDFEVRSVAGLEAPDEVPAEVVLLPSRPSPFAGSTEIRFGLPRSRLVRLGIYGVDGRLVATLAEGVYPAGYHRAVWAGSDLAGRHVSPGIYFSRLTTDDGSITRKLLRVR